MSVSVGAGLSTHSDPLQAGAQAAGLAAAELGAVHSMIAPQTLIGASFEGGDATPFHATITEDRLEHRLDGLPLLASASGAIILSDPYTLAIRSARRAPWE